MRAYTWEVSWKRRPWETDPHVLRRPKEIACVTVDGDLLGRRTGFPGNSPPPKWRVLLRRDWGTNALYRDFVPLQMGSFVTDQKGFTTARITMAIINTVGTSFQMR